MPLKFQNKNKNTSNKDNKWMNEWMKWLCLVYCIECKLSSVDTLHLSNFTLWNNPVRSFGSQAYGFLFLSLLSLCSFCISMPPISFTNPGIFLPLRSRLVVYKQLGVWIKTMSVRSSNPRHEQRVCTGTLFFMWDLIT